MEEKELTYLCALSRIFLFKPSLVNGILTAGLLNDIFEGPDTLLRELFCEDKEAAEKIRDPALLEQTAADLKWMRGKEVSVLEITNERYPRLLKECPDAPPVLYYIGKAELNPSRSISMVNPAGILLRKRVLPESGGLFREKRLSSHDSKRTGVWHRYKRASVGFGIRYGDGRSASVRD